MSLASNIHELLLGGSSGTYSYTINNSLRLRSSASAYLSRTPASSGSQTTWTYSCWMKLGPIGSGNQQIFGTRYTASGPSATLFRTNNGVLDIAQYTSGTLVWEYSTTQVLRDPSAWYHLVLVIDTTQSISSNRIKLYINGLQSTLTAVVSSITQNSSTYVNSTNAHGIGALLYGDGSISPIQVIDSYLAEVNFIDGLALDPSYFGATNSTTGTWAPKAYSGSYGTNGFYLPFSDTSGLTSGSNTGVGKDFSGNGNYWNTNNISLTAGSTYDAMLDSPTPKSTTVGNYAVLNPLQTGSYVTGSNANLTITGNTATNSALALSSIANLTSGKWYWEYTQGTVGSETCGAMLQAMNGISLLDGEATTTSYGIGVRASGSVYGASKTTTTITSWTTGDVIGIAVDIDNGAIYWSKNGGWLNSGVPTSGASKTGAVGAWTPSSSVVVTPSFGAYNGGSISATFGQRPFAYTPPTGFKALQTYNLPTPAIYKGANHFASTLFTATSGTNTITNSVNGIGFKPDLIWLKSRSNIQSNYLVDSVRGGSYLLRSESTGAETFYNTPSWITSFDTNGFTSSSDSLVSIGYTYVGWQWKGGGTAVTNTNGSITSQVSANPSAGFSVVTFTGNNTVAATFGHGLGVTPSFAIIKRRDNTGDWFATMVVGTGVQRLLLNTTAAGSSSSPISTFFTSTTIQPWYFDSSGSGLSNVNSATYVAYCFAAIPGYSAFGSYTGNGSADGPFVFTGMRPRWIMVKRTDAAPYDWLVWDSSRNTYNVANALLQPDGAAAEVVGTDYVVDLLSNGFKIRSNTANAMNASGGSYIYAAFAENPFQYSLAR